MTIEFSAPIRIVSESNRSTGHWSNRHRRFKAQKGEIWWTWKAMGQKAPELPVTVTITRISPRQFDDDNMISGCKGIRDQIAGILNADDGDKRITWRYAQERGQRKQYAVRIRIEATT